MPGADGPVRGVPVHEKDGYTMTEADQRAAASGAQLIGEFLDRSTLTRNLQPLIEQG
jgi:hypothetical protein